jgi:hypothetical protein
VVRSTATFSGGDLGGALVPLGALFFWGGGKPSQANDISVETGNVAGEVLGMARGLLGSGIKARPDLSVARNEPRTPPTR